MVFKVQGSQNSMMLDPLGSGPPAAPRNLAKSSFYKLLKHRILLGLVLYLYLMLLYLLASTIETQIMEK